MKTRKALSALVGLAFSLPALAQTVPAKTTKPSTSAHKITAATSCPDLSRYYANILAEEMVANLYWSRWGYGGGYGGGYGRGGGWGGVPMDRPSPVLTPKEPTVAPTRPAAAPSAGRGDSVGDGAVGWGGGAAADASPSHFTGTNTQEQAVDELDFVKTDGKYVYIVKGQALHIYRAWPVTEIKKVGTFALDNYPMSFFLYKDRALVVGSAENTKLPSGYGTRLTLIDLSDRSKPKEVRRYDMEGDLISGRMVGDEVYLVQSHYLDWSSQFYDALDNANAAMYESAEEVLNATLENPRDPRPELRKLAQSFLQKELAKSDISALMPKVLAQVPGGSEGKAAPLYDCNDIFHPSQPVQYGMMGVVHLDLGDEAKSIDGAGIFGQGWNVYASENNLYLTTTDEMFGWPYYDGWASYGTEIHKFNLGGVRGVNYAGSGKVRGSLLNQFSMSEHNGFLRVATTSWNDYSGTQKNHLSVFEPQGKKLVKVGSIDDIAKGEDLQAVRMIGDKGYLVTFQQVDPLFTLDLKDPRKPKIVGELKIPGFSSYLHPMDKDHLLAVGTDADESGRVLGLQIAIFDVSNMATPKQVQKYTFKDAATSSEATYDHHAFTYYNGKLAIPLQSYGQKNGVYQYKSEMAVFQVDAVEGISEVGRVSHDELWQKSCEDLKRTNPSSYGGFNCAVGYGYAPVQRSVMIDDLLLSISEYGLKANALSLPKTEYASFLFSAQ